MLRTIDLKRIEAAELDRDDNEPANRCCAGCAHCRVVPRPKVEARIRRAFEVVESRAELVPKAAAASTGALWAMLKRAAMEAAPAWVCAYELDDSKDAADMRRAWLHPTDPDDVCEEWEQVEL